MLKSSLFGDRRCEVALFDVAAAFPRLEWRWNFHVLNAQGVPSWVRWLLRGLMVGSTVRVSFGGSVASAAVLMARGMKQGCPTSGSVWVLAFDPIVRLASYKVVAMGGSICLRRCVTSLLVL